MKELNSIPTSKIERAAKFVSTGAKVGVNYIKHYARSIITSNLDTNSLNADNATDIYNSLSEMKGSVLKLAQMLSMDKGILPKEYVEKFSLAQFNTPPLSAPLVRKVFKTSLGKYPEEVFDYFDPKAKYAASIGQVHLAYKDGIKLAVKIQYPGVADSIKSDLKIAKPLASKLFNIKPKELEKYLSEVEVKLIEETDYKLELKQSVEIAKACKNIENIIFPTYFEELSSDKILTMTWIDGLHVSEFLAQNPSQETRNKVGQALWDFYLFQSHNLMKIHADPHPGNFLIGKDGQLAVIDFGCVKSVPQEFYVSFYAVSLPEVMNSSELFEYHLLKLEMIRENESQEKKDLIKKLFKELLIISTLPFQTPYFDFGDESYLAKLYTFGEELAKMDEIRNDDPRGSRHFIYINRTFYGLYSLLTDLKAKIKTGMPWKEYIRTKIGLN
jgi:predicted unusual protein kinase regulating ubiquinone biosynthesis (AarF/ABC1/UbiB family)